MLRDPYLDVKVQLSKALDVPLLSGECTILVRRLAAPSKLTKFAAAGRESTDHCINQRQLEYS